MRLVPFLMLGVVACGSRRAPTQAQGSCGPAIDRPHIVMAELSAEDRAAIEARARLGTVALRLDGCVLRTVPECVPTGAYAYAPQPITQHTQTVVRERGELAMSATTIGAWVAPAVDKSTMSGDCSRATHYAQALAVGAFELRARGSLAEDDGARAACSHAPARPGIPPEGCGALVAAQIRPLPKGAAPVPVAPASAQSATCPLGTHWDELGRCAQNVPIPPRTIGATVKIPTGTFFMGGHEKNPRSVTVTAFELDLTEVTVAAYKACVDAGICSLPGVGNLCNYPARLNHPINCVDWEQSKTYCKAVQKRLPREAEWEYAGRGTDGRAYPWGNDPPKTQLCWGRSGIGVRTGGPTEGSCAVGEVLGDRSPFGIIDMAGNVSEWMIEEGCPESVPGCSPTSQGGAGAQTRGWNWEHRLESQVPLWMRHGQFADTRRPTLGFRCAR
jgi:formylglycine-generating enzyme required for sulfatase activity